MDNFSNKSTEEIKELYEDFDEIGRKLAECFDALAILHEENRLDTIEIPSNLANLADTLLFIHCAKEDLAQVAKKTHTVDKDEKFLNEMVLARLRGGNLSFHA